jgi:Hexamethylene bis-acetamide-inducible protein
MMTTEESVTVAAGALPADIGMRSAISSGGGGRIGGGPHSGRKRKLEAAAAASSDSEDEELTASRKLLLLTSEQQHRRRKPRRRRRRGGSGGGGANKRPLEKSYYELNEAERSGLERREQERADRQRARKIAQGASAPYNTTQFILLDHQAGDEDVERLERQLAGGGVKQRRRTVSLEEEDFHADEVYADDVIGQREGEEEEEEQAVFLSQQFRRDYDRLNADRLERLAKESIIDEYLLLEKTVERLEARLEAITAREEAKARRGEADYEFHRGEVPMEPDMAAKIRIFQAEIARLSEENSRLLVENGDLQRQLRLHDDDSDCTSSSSSDSSSSSSSSSESSSEDDSETEEEPESSEYIAEYVEGLPKMMLAAEEGKTDDTGYESTQSKEQTPEREIRSAASDHHRAVALEI